MQFSTTSGASSANDLIPAGQLSWALLTFRGMKVSDSTGSRYGDLEFAIADNQPNQRRKIWDMVADPDFDGNSEKWRAQGMSALTRMVEAAGIVNPEDPASYEKLNGKTCEQVLMMLDGKYVAIKVKIEKGGEGYADKNKVGDYLTPNPQSSGNKGYVKLSNGDFGIAAANPAAARAGNGGFGSTGQPRVAPAPGGGANGGFGHTHSGFAGHQGGQGANPAVPFVGATLTTKSPSDAPQAGHVAGDAQRGGFNPNAAPGFLARHNP